MYEVTCKQKEIDGVAVDVYCRDVNSACVLGVEAGTTGYKGGDSGHGGRTYFSVFTDCGDFQCNLLGKDGSNGFELSAGGDCELETLVKALKFITKVLEDQIADVND